MCTNLKMRSVNLVKTYKNKSSWHLATLLIKKYLDTRHKASVIFDNAIKSVSQKQIKSTKSLYYGALRNINRIEYSLNTLIKKKPNNLILSIFFTTGYQLIDDKNEKIAKIIHFAVENSKSLVSDKEVKFINALLRKISTRLSNDSPEISYSIYYSHPQWLIDRWINQFGDKNTESLLQWNQGNSKTYLLSKNPIPESNDEMISLLYDNGLNFKENSSFKKLYLINGYTLNNPIVRNLLKNGDAYIKDPSTLHAVDFLDPKPGESVLDLCASPGGKSFDCLIRMKNKGNFVAVDYGRKKIIRLENNIKGFRSSKLSISCLNYDIRELSDNTFIKNNLPIRYDAILIDVPCSNTGVIQRKPDIRYRLSKNDFEHNSLIQIELLKSASLFLNENGRIVYSTCSIDAIENDNVIRNFLNSNEGSSYYLESSGCYYPWVNNHDGAGVFLFRKKGS